MSQDVAAAFPDRSTAEQAVDALVASGIDPGHIELRSGELEDQVGPPVATVTGAHRVALICAVLGGVVSAIFAVLMAMGIVPGRGFEFLGTTVVGAAFRGAGAGGAAGALFGYILGMGMWEDDGEPESPVALGETIVRIETASSTGSMNDLLTRSGGRLL